MKFIKGFLKLFGSDVVLKAVTTLLIISAIIFDNSDFILMAILSSNLVLVNNIKK